MVESMICGYHEYKTVWENPVLAEKLHCLTGNPCYPAAVAIQNQISGEMFIVGQYLWVGGNINGVSSYIHRHTVPDSCRLMIGATI